MQGTHTISHSSHIHTHSNLYVRQHWAHHSPDRDHGGINTQRVPLLPDTRDPGRHQSPGPHHWDNWHQVCHSQCGTGYSSQNCPLEGMNPLSNLSGVQVLRCHRGGCSWVPPWRTFPHSVFWGDHGSSACRHELRCLKENSAWLPVESGCLGTLQSQGKAPFTEGYTGWKALGVCQDFSLKQSWFHNNFIAWPDVHPLYPSLIDTFV